MKVAYCQCSPRFGEVHENVTRTLSLCEQSIASLFVFPELFSTGYLFTSKDEVEQLSEEIPSGETSQRLMEFCRRKGAFITAGMAERSEGRFYNAAGLFGPDGHLSTYRKLHLFQDEKDWFSPGNLPFSVIDIGEARIGIMICFDWIFPEAARTLALMGAEIICHPSNLVLPNCPAAMITRSLENRVFSITADRVGEEERGGRKLRYIGTSQIVSPSGEILARSGEEEEAMIEVEITPEKARNKKILQKNDIFLDRRSDYYGD
ncbi:MAG: nitrilase-related carbon-nitrogen hydrolase [Candidatus Xenobiia bacterium LiM19]